MPLPLPVLDQRTWAELVSEGRSLIPRHAPTWTDHNVHDPGVTLLELFAWVSELLMFRADRIPPAELRAFLRWLGIERAPAGLAATAVALRLPPGAPPVTLPGGLLVEDPVSGVVFEADDPARVSAAWIELDPAEGTQRGRIFSRSAGGFADLSADNCRPGHAFLALGPEPAPGDALWLGFDVLPATAGEGLWLHIWTPVWTDDDELRARLIAAAQDPTACPEDPPWTRHYSALVVWEGWDGASWQPLEVLLDETRALTLTGSVRLRAGTLAPGPATAPDPARHWLRCRLARGAYECPPRLAGVAVNVVVARHAAQIAGPEVLDVSRGHAEEAFLLDGRIAAQGAGARVHPVIAGSLRLRVVAGGVPDDSWVEVPDWDRSGPFDRHYVLDPARNAIRFGNGRAGSVPPAGATVEAREYRVGGGPDGNVAAGRLTQLLAGGAAGLEVRQPFGALGGTSAETLDQAHGRALARLTRPARGVTLADLEALALDVPGVPVARAAAIPERHPDVPCWPAAGVVTVVVVPACGRPPRPGPDLLAAVRRHLARRRPLTAELHVVGPTYVAVTVNATLHVVAGAAMPAARAQAALDAFFDPLTGGPAGAGWPFGRAVMQSDLLGILDRLAGVDYVDGLSIDAAERAGRCENLELCPTDLVDSQTHRITVVEG